MFVLYSKVIITFCYLTRDSKLVKLSEQISHSGTYEIVYIASNHAAKLVLGKYVTLYTNI